MSRSRQSFVATGQFTAADYDYQGDESYTYDANGNRVLANGSTYTTGTNNRLVSDGSYRYLYDAEGNRTYRFVDNNQNGQLDSGDADITKYFWDHRNRLYKVQHQASYGAAVDWVIRQSYDHENRLVRRRMDGDGDGDYEQKRVFAYDGNQIVLDFQHTVAGDAGASDLRWRYLWGPAVDQILAEEEVDGGTADLVAWTLTDHLNTVPDIAKYDPQTGTTTVVNHLVYDAFGRVTSESELPTNRAHLMRSRQRELAVDPSGLEKFYVCGYRVPPGGNMGQGTANKCGCFHMQIYGDKSGLAYEGWYGGQQKPLPGGGGIPTGAGWKCYPLRRASTTVIPIPSPVPILPIVEEKKISWGPAKGKSCRDATDADIVACLRGKPGKPKDQRAGVVENCQTDCFDAAEGCCLTGFRPATILPPPQFSS